MKTVYLTIDDAPSPDMKRKIITLAERNIPCVWFCQGNFLEERPEYALFALKNGHIIGNHSYSHPQFSNISITQAVEEIAKADVVIEDLYRQCGMTWEQKYFRFPWGDKGDFLYGDVTKSPSEEGSERRRILQATLQMYGYTQPTFADITNTYHRSTGIFDDIDWRWTFDAMEYGLRYEEKYDVRTIEDVWKRMDEDDASQGRSLNTPGSSEIIVLHDNEETAKHFPDIIDRLVQKGLRFSDVRNCT